MKSKKRASKKKDPSDEGALFSKEKSTKKKVSEIFKVKEGKNAKEKTIKSSGVEEIPLTRKDQIKKENKQLKILLFVSGALVLMFLSIYFILESEGKYEHEGVKFELERYCDARPCLNVYKTTIPVMHNGQAVPYNFYLRTNPDKLGEIVFDGGFDFREILVINATKEFDCKGEQVIAVANIVKLYEVLGIKVMKDEEATCDPEGNYMFIRLLPGETTSVKQTGPVCYDIYIKDCEILKATERFMLESFVEVNQILNS